MANAQHEFALYYAELPIKKGEFLIADQELIGRLSRVLRLRAGDICVLFNEQAHARCELVSFEGSKRCSMKALEYKSNVALSPHITVLLPLLKRDDLHQALYELAACGVNEIQLLETAKVQAPWRSEKELERLQRVVIAAAEQSKQYAFPVIHSPVLFEKAIKEQQEIIFADPSGQPLLQLLQAVQQNHPKKITLLVGPEADLTEQEKKILVEQKTVFVQLTPTVLRAHQAISLLTGVVRSLRF